MDEEPDYKDNEWDDSEDDDEVDFNMDLSDDSEDDDDSDIDLSDDSEDDEDSEDSNIDLSSDEDDDSEDSDMDLSSDEDEDFEDSNIDLSSDEDDTSSDEDASGFPTAGNISMNSSEEEDNSSVLNDSDSFEAAIKSMAGAFTLSQRNIFIPGDVVLLEYVKASRRETHLGLTQSIREMGQLEPIVVMETASYATFKRESPEGVFTGKKYILIDGLRRLYSMIALKVEQARATIMSFDDPEKATDVAVLIRCLYNKSERMSWPELWGYLQVLDESFTLAPNIEEYLLGLDGGDVMKLKDIMANKDNYPDTVDDLFSKKKTLMQAYNALNKARKEEDKLAIEDQAGISQIDEASDIVDDTKQEGLSEDEVKDVLEMANSDLSDGDFAGEDAGADLAMGADDYGAQDVHDRHPLDPAVKQAVLRRDNFTCVCCGLTGTPFLGALVVHHPIPVLASGTDKFESPVFIESDDGKTLRLNPDNNLVTLCEACHITIHSIQFKMGGKVPMTKEEYEGYSPEMKERLRRLKLFIDVAVRADKKLGKKRGGLRVEHRKPWEGVEDAVAAYNGFKPEDAKPVIEKESEVEDNE